MTQDQQSGGSSTTTNDEAGMYGSDVMKASDLLYEVGSWLHDVIVGRTAVDDMYEAVYSRLVPAADAAVAEHRALAALVEARVRQQLAQKIEANADQMEPTTQYREGVIDGHYRAARVVRGDQEGQK